MINLQISPFQAELFNKFYDKLIYTNKLFNLTAITDKDEVYEKHFFDSIQLAPLINKNASIVDIGSGAGFPAIPLAIVRADLNITMVDCLQKRVNYLNDCTRLLKLDNASAIHSRAEDAVKIYREKFDYATARAVAKLPTLLEYCLPFVKVGGYFIAFKGQDYQNELFDAKNALLTLGGKLEKVVKYTLKEAGQTRYLLVFKKEKTTPLKYPRGKNLPKDKPL